MHPKVQKKIVLVFGVFIITFYCGHRQALLALGYVDINLNVGLMLTGQMIELSAGQSQEKTFSFSLSLCIIEIYFIHNISAPDIVFSTYNNISRPNCAIILHFALNTRNTF